MRESFFATHAAMEDAHWWFLARRDILEVILSECARRGSTGTVLDIGCGTGGNTARFAHYGRAIGVEPSPEAVRLARQRFPSLTFVEGFAPDDVLREASLADVFVLTDVLEHVEEDSVLVGRLVGVAKPGAFFIVTVPANEKLWTEHDVSHGHYRRYSMESFTTLWAGAGVDTTLLSYFNSRLLPLVYTVRQWERWRGKAFGEAGTDLRLPPRPVNSVLRKIFAGESAVLRRHFGKPGSAYRDGVSLIGVFQKHK
jgi:SAM-dependent methyltransferase